MKKNVGSVERIIRIIAGAAILSLAFVCPETPWAFLGIVPLATGLHELVPALCALAHFHLRQDWQLRHHHRGTVVLREQVAERRCKQ